MKRIIFTLIALVQTFLIPAQPKQQQYTIKATVLARNTNILLPYANVYNKQLSIGTASNLKGYFELPNNRIGDTIVVSYLGYVDEMVIVSKEKVNEIKLSPIPTLLGEIVVTANSDYLYDIIGEIKKNKRTITKTSKTYFYLETMLFNEPVEIIEAYYNGKYSDLGVEALQFKKGRIGLKPVNKRYFSSTESSRLFSMHDVFIKSDLFPDNPFSHNSRKLKKVYSLKLNHTFEENGAKVYVIDFKPKDENKDLFKGTIWVDRGNKKLIKISLEIDQSTIHPFMPIGYNTIQNVDMKITKSYKNIEGEQFLNAMDFNYNVFYIDKWGNEVVSTTKAFTKAYDYEVEFNLPYFKFTKHLHEDYRNITGISYDSIFWSGTTEFRFYDRLQEVETFIKENRIKKGIIFPQRESTYQQLQFPYISWNETRFEMNQSPVNVIERSKRNVPFERDRYNLEVNLYLDINPIGNNLTYQVKTILDPVLSYYYFYMSNHDYAFMNMYFDLMEIEKRKLETELSLLENPSLVTIESAYNKHLNKFRERSESFISETKRGQNIKQMESWSQYIFETLGVDNFKLFGLAEKK